MINKTGDRHAAKNTSHLERLLSAGESRIVDANVVDSAVRAAIHRYGLAEYVGGGPDAVDRFDGGETECPVCRVHGGAAPQVKAARLRRIQFAEALQADPVRRADEILVDVLHASDYAMRQVRQEISADKLTVETTERLVSLTETAGRWAKTTLDAGVNERIVRLAEAQGAMVADVLQRIFVDLKLSPEQWTKVGEVVPAHLRRLTAIEGGKP